MAISLLRFPVLVSLALAFVLSAQAQRPAPVPTPKVSARAMQDLGARLATRINMVRLQDPRAQHAIWGISVVDLATSASLYAENADKLFQPASNTKLFTTATALALIGAEDKFVTTDASERPPDNVGLIARDLVLVGGGDPELIGRPLPLVGRTEVGRRHP